MLNALLLLHADTQSKKHAPVKGAGVMQGPTLCGVTLDVYRRAGQITDPKRQAAVLRAEKEAHQHRLEIAARREKLANSISEKPAHKYRKEIIDHIGKQSEDFSKDKQALQTIKQYQKLSQEIHNLDTEAKKRHTELSLAQLDAVKLKLEQMNRLVPQKDSDRSSFYDEMARNDILNARDKQGDIQVSAARKIGKESGEERKRVAKRLTEITPREDALSTISKKSTTEINESQTPVKKIIPLIHNEKFLQWVSTRMSGGADKQKMGSLVKEYNAFAGSKGDVGVQFSDEDFDAIVQNRPGSTRLSPRMLEEARGFVTTKDANGFIVTTNAPVMSALSSAEFASYLRAHADKNGLVAGTMSLTALKSEIKKFNDENLHSRIVLDARSEALFNKVAKDGEDQNDVAHFNLGSLYRVDREIHYAAQTEPVRQARGLKILVAETAMQHEQLVAMNNANDPSNLGYASYLLSAPVNLWHSAKDKLGINRWQHGREIGAGAVDQRLEESEKSVAALKVAVDAELEKIKLNKPVDWNQITTARKKCVAAQNEAGETIQKHVEAIESGTRTGKIILASTAAIGVTVGTAGTGAPVAVAIVAPVLAGAAVKTTLDFADKKTSGNKYEWIDLAQSVGEGGFAGLGGGGAKLIEEGVTAVGSKYLVEGTKQLVLKKAVLKVGGRMLVDGTIGAGNEAETAYVQGQDLDQILARAKTGFGGGVIWGGAMHSAGLGLQKLKSVAPVLSAGIVLKSAQLKAANPEAFSNVTAGGNRPISAGTTSGVVTETVVDSSGAVIVKAKDLAASKPAASPGGNTTSQNTPAANSASATNTGSASTNGNQSGSAGTPAPSANAAPVANPAPASVTPAVTPSIVSATTAPKVIASPEAIAKSVSELRTGDSAKLHTAVEDLLSTPEGQVTLAKELKSQKGILNGRKDKIWNAVFNTLEDKGASELKPELLSTLKDHRARGLRGRLSPKTNRKFDQAVTDQKVDLSEIDFKSRKDRGLVKNILANDKTRTQTAEAVTSGAANNAKPVTTLLKNPGGRFSERTGYRVELLKQMKGKSLANLSESEQKEFLKTLDGVMRKVSGLTLRGRRSSEATAAVEALADWYKSADEPTKQLLVKPLSRITRIWSQRKTGGVTAIEALSSSSSVEVQNSLIERLQKSISSRERKALISALTKIGTNGDGLTLAAFEELNKHTNLFNRSVRHPIGDIKGSVRKVAQKSIEDVKVKIDINDAIEQKKVLQMLNNRSTVNLTLRSLKASGINDTFTVAVQDKLHIVAALKYKAAPRFRLQIQKNVLAILSDLNDAGLSKLSEKTKNEISRLSREAKDQDLRSTASALRKRIQNPQLPAETPNSVVTTPEKTPAASTAAKVALSANGTVNSEPSWYGQMVTGGAGS